LAPVGLVALAACQTVQEKPSDKAGTSSAATQTTPSTPATGAQQPQAQAGAEQQAAPVQIFLADTQEQAGWARVDVQPNGVLFVNPRAVVVREDLVGVQAGTNDSKEGLLALDLTPEAAQRLLQVTTQFPKKRLALVVGDTMLAAPAYGSPVKDGRLIFMVGTEANALAAARAIAGPQATQTNGKK
jgi:preprotein translocase subunit SecD